ncbi:MAG TPA: DUF4395 domain-containing protein [Candidatus Acidoferrum sp.]|jgi:hypothetical protein|nr:DUF4395 domain-containing protein [Candidatus Acidoferrum sp.]
MSTPIPVRLIDPRGQRFGAGFSAVLLAAGIVLNAPVVPLLVAIALAVSAAFGSKYWALGRPWPTIRRLARLGPPESPEPELGPRFAQGFGFIVLTVGLVFMVLGVPLLGWVLVGAVAALQTVLAVTGICIGCMLYGLHWWLPEVFDRFVFRVPVGGGSSTSSTS